MNGNLNRPKSRLDSRRKALANINDGVDQDDMFILTIDNDLRMDNFNRIRKSLTCKNYEAAIDDLIKLNNKIKPDDENDLYSLVLDDLDTELKDILKPREIKRSKSFAIKTKISDSENIKVVRQQPSKCIPIMINKRKTQDLINSCSFTSSSPA
jgi:hypothetical protein